MTESSKTWPIKLLFFDKVKPWYGLGPLVATCLDNLLPKLVDKYDSKFYHVALKLGINGTTMESEDLYFYTKSKNFLTLDWTDKFVKLKESDAIKLFTGLRHSDLTINVTKSVYLKIYNTVKIVEPGNPFENQFLNNIFHISNQFLCGTDVATWKKVNKKSEIVYLDGDIVDEDLKKDDEIKLDDDDAITYDGLRMNLKSSFSSEFICYLLQTNLGILTDVSCDRMSPSLLWKKLLDYSQESDGQYIVVDQ